MVGGIGLDACLPQCANGDAHPLVVALPDERADALVGLLHAVDDDGEAECGHMVGIFPLQVVDEVGQETRLLVSLRLDLDGVVTDVLVQHLYGLRYASVRHVPKACHRLLVADVEGTAVVVGLFDTVCDEALG